MHNMKLVVAYNYLIPLNPILRDLILENKHPPLPSLTSATNPWQC